MFNHLSLKKDFQGKNITQLPWCQYC